jgi:CDP-glucose 4,6-dehydratase
MDLNPDLWRGKRVLVTGHTGFKGSWLVFWLRDLGAEIIGLSLPPQDSGASLYLDAGINNLVSHEFFIDIRDEFGVQKVIQESKPDYVFHLAAQAFIRRSFKNPKETFTTNIVGTLNVLVSALSFEFIKGITIVTTDKVYENIGPHKPFREVDKLGNKDPYSASKAAAELVVASINSTCNSHCIPITTVRAGNVIGGGDWGENRLVPDLVMALSRNKTLSIRRPNATRPWQHILDCLRGYLLIGQVHLENSLEIPTSINFGPSRSLSVTTLIDIFERVFGNKIQYMITNSNFAEASQLELDSKLALDFLGWSTIFSPETAIELTASWYSKFLNGSDALELMSIEIENFKALLR